MVNNIYRRLAEELSDLLPDENRNKIIGNLGYRVNNVYSVVDPQNPQKYRVRVKGGGYITAFHKGRVSPTPDLSVELVKDGNSYEITGAYAGDMQNNANMQSSLYTNNVGKHTHERYSGNEFDVDARMFKQFGVRIIGGSTVRINGGYYYIGNDVKYIPTAEIDLSSHIPATPGNKRWGVICIDTVENAFSVVQGANIPGSILMSLSQVELVVIPSDFIRICAVKLINGHSSFNEPDFESLHNIAYYNTGGGGPINLEWGNITGTLSDQTDLQNALNNKLDVSAYIPVTVANPPNGLGIVGQEISLDLADASNAGAMPPDMFEVLSTGRTYLGYEFFTSSGTFAKADYPNAKWLKVTMCGGGGGGSSTANLTQCGSGGAGSCWCVAWIDINDISASEAVTIGAGGTAGIAGGGQGGTGGSSAFAGVTSGFGGGGGNPSVFNQGGTSYAGSGTANFRFSGSGGQSGGNIAGVGSGMGGSCAWGGGAQGRAGQANVAGIAGSAFGGGGAGGTHPSQPAGAGAQGFVLIEVYG